MGGDGRGSLKAKSVEDVLASPAVKDILTRDNGVIHRHELLSVGLSAAQVRDARKRRILTQVFPQVFALATANLDFRGYLRGACKWIPEAVVSHRSAAVLLGLDGVRAAPVELTTPSHYRSRRGAKLRQTSDLPRADIMEVERFRVTTVPRTLIDLSALVSEENLAYAVESAWRKEMVTIAALRARFEARRSSGVDGAASFDAVLRDCESRPRFFDSGAELRFWRMLHQARLPIPEIQVEVHSGRMRLDFLYRRVSLIIETGGGGTKGTPEAYNKETRRSSQLVSEGYRVMPISWEMLEKAPERVIHLVRGALRHAGAGSKISRR
jgi:very-short-patch-repair endonuclease